ncbi:MAG: C25 family cysteine peptidase, partial [Candidatus Tectomicrobia bacterium]|nr:C25 family cysteine peptidase [Candidatus Tectomicrobia bacterium]
PQSFPFTLEHKERALYLATVKNGEAENFFGAVLAQEPVEQILTLRHLDPASPADAQVEVILQGATTGVHQVIVQINGYEVGTLIFPGQTREAVTFPIPQAWLQDAENVVTLTPIDDEAVSVVDAIRLAYWHTYTADDDILRFTIPSQSSVTVTGFSQPGIRVIDITDPQAIRELLGHVASQDMGYAVSVAAGGEGNRTLLAFTDAQIKLPDALSANTPSRWHHPAQGADLVIIAPMVFHAAIAPLKRLREAQGWTVALIDIQNLYDEFNFGDKSPWALRRFLHWAHRHWQPAPRFVLLFGDASIDPRNYLGLGDVDFVPTRLVATSFLETASDDWFADFDEDGVPELAIGRLPVRSVEEAATIVAKLVRYAESDDAGRWTRDALFVADDTDIFDFTAASAAVAALLPPDLTVTTLALEETDVATVRRDLLAHLNEGQLLVNYMGHGSTEVWAGGELLTSADARALVNGARLPVVVAMNCLNGFFHDLYTDSLAEALLKAEQGGAVAVWASSGLTGPSAQAIMNQELVRSLFGKERLTLGEAIRRAKAAVADRDVRRTWGLFGDPAIRLK